MLNANLDNNLMYLDRRSNVNILLTTLDERQALSMGKYTYSIMVTISYLKEVSDLARYNIHLLADNIISVSIWCFTFITKITLTHYNHQV